MGNPLKEQKDLKKADHELVSSWILAHTDELNKAWEMINMGLNPGSID